MFELLFMAHEIGEALGSLFPCGSGSSTTTKNRDVPPNFKPGSLVVSNMDGRMIVVHSSDYYSGTFYSYGNLYQRKDFRVATPEDKIFWEKHQKRQGEERKRLYDISVKRGFPLTDAELDAIMR